MINQKKLILMRPDSDLLAEDVIIVSLETNVEGNNVNVSFKFFKNSKIFTNFYLNYKMGGGGIFATLLSALINQFTVTLKLLDYPYPAEIIYITGILVKGVDTPT
ncbi:hypothetical protein XBO1_1800004 [Xenorhabdus bovienii str. oregonense]|uniref:Uncharacterized protein n=1 Tax=Xenorhabdus bovienii str. oregonense TaxID=1398202 RepID=A0A077P394_XENBV|nr:hypothetical protein [Xenorhabdus bovienii]CDH05219.1 hypothetical protein XBO1_1800004 [Xenorhabdus bovienii str. oregonense]